MNAKELIYSILKFSDENKLPDIHLNTGHFPIYRNNSWDISYLTEINWEKLEKLTKENIIQIILEISSEIALEKFEKNFELDTSYEFESGTRYRVNCYIDSKGYSIALRIIPKDIPTLDSLGLWEQVKNMCNKSKWLILVTWPTWSWKSTNLAAMINYINENYKKHIITIEDPVEFSFVSKNSLVNQREVWNHTKWFDEAIRACLREDPDVIMVWEMRDPETIKAALTLAETWHLVLSTLHTNDSVQTVDRIVDIFPSSQQKQIRMQLAMSLVWIISQRLIPRSDKEWRIAAREILISDDAVKNLIVTWKTPQLYSVLEIWQQKWMILMDRYLIALHKKWIIDKDTLFSFVRDKEAVEMLI